jgi:TonB-linked SusC/RagA family outer membrane protein
MKQPLPAQPPHVVSRQWQFISLIIAFLLVVRPVLAMKEGSVQSIEEVKISLFLKDASLQKAFIAIEKKSEFKFVTSIERIDRKKKVSVSIENKTVKEVLETILAGTGLGYTQINNNIIINNKPVSRATSVEKVEAPAAVRTLAQEVAGTVKDTKGAGIPGTNILVKGTTVGTSTNTDGKYSINVADDNSVLIFSSISYISQEINVGSRTSIDIVLQEDVKILGEVVVTALGIEKDAKSVTYAQQNVGGEELTRVKDPNMINSLAGKAAGVVITKGTGGPGSSSKVLLRGNKSITGNNQPLYVIDGIPMNAANSPQGSTLFDTRDAGDAISNLNPEDIENISILKGASAAALYGSQAANGVILVTTKKGRKGFSSINFSSTANFENPIALPQVQTTYGQGYGGVANTAVNDSWGPKITNGSDKHLKEFFQTGKTFVNSLSITNGNDIGQFYVSYANTKANGIVPENDYKRHNINLRGTTQLFNNKLSLDASVNYIEQKVYNRPQAGFYFSPIFSLYLFPTGDDFSKYSGKNYQKWDPSRLMNVQNWPYIKNEASSNQNPYWLANKNQTDQFRSRTIYAMSAKWALTDWLNVQGRATYDKVQDSFELRQYASSDATLVGSNGGYRKNLTNTDQLYSDILLSGTKTFGKDLFLSATLGFSNTQNTFYDLNVGNNGATNTLSYPNYFSVYALQSQTGQGFFNATESLQKRLSQAFFGTATVGYKETVFLDVTARKEWSSTVNQSFFYPSVGLSYVLTENLKPSDILSFAKVRASYAEVGNALPFGFSNWTPPYTLSNDENVNGRSNLPFFNGNDTLNLKPERTRSYEIGTELKLFKNKLNVNFTYYNATTYDQVFQILAPPGSGATNFYINGGTIRNKGFESTISYNAELGEGISWTPGLNFSRNVNQIRELSNLLTANWFVLQASGSTRMLQLFLTKPGIPNLGGREYGSYGDMFGKTYQRDENGNIKYNETTGLPLLSAGTDQYLGNANPKFLMGFTNQFKYKNATLSFLVDGRFGGKIASMTEQWLDFKGISKRSGDARDAGGVMVNGKQIPAETYYNFISGKGDVAAAAEEYMFSATNVRLRELALGYTFPKVSKVIKDISVSFISRNLFFFYKDAPFDPEVSITTANSMQGIEGFSIPATRSYGFTVRATF